MSLQDRLLADLLLSEKKQWIVRYHEHDSLLENKVCEDLTEEERKAAWEEYEDEKKRGYRTIVRGRECCALPYSTQVDVHPLRCGP